MAIRGKKVSASYIDILTVSNSNSGVDATTRNVMSGNGATTGLHVSTNNTLIKSATNTTTALQVQNADGTNLLQVNTTASAVKALGHYVNTNIKEFSMSSGSSKPSTTDTWTALLSNGAGRAPAFIEMGTGGTPATTLTISTTGDELVLSMWYVPFNITIINVYVWFGADAASGDTVKFSVMAYDIDDDNGSTGGDLSNGVEHCASASTIAGAGYEQAYYQRITPSTANVDSGKALMAFVHQDGTNADLSVNMQIVYNLR